MRKSVYVNRKPVPDAGHLFEGLRVGPVERVQWVAKENKQDRGQYWVAPSEGIYWVSDGHSRIAVAVEERVFRFCCRGIDNRLGNLANRYLCCGLVPVPVGSIAINFGANIGELSLVLSGMGADVIAIEPDPGVIRALVSNAIGRRIKVGNFAAWREDGQLKLYLKTKSADTSVFKVSDHSIVVQAHRIDTIAGDLDQIHLIAGDAEGAEPEVLEGARETLKRTNYVSVCASAERQGEKTQDACEAILKDCGFDIILKEDSGFCTLIGRNRVIM